MISAPAFDSRKLRSTELVNSRPRSSRNSTSIPNLAKTTGFLAFILCSAAQAADQPNRLNRPRELQETGALEGNSFDYVSACKKGVPAIYVNGTNYEDCLAVHKSAIDSSKQAASVRGGKAKKCYVASGYVALGSFGAAIATGFLACVTEIDRQLLLKTALSAISLGFLGLVPTLACVPIYKKPGNTASSSQSAADRCCRIFPKKADL